MSRTVRAAVEAEDDLRDILRHSHKQFGDQARDRYRRLIAEAYKALSADPDRVGVFKVSDRVRIFHLRQLQSTTAVRSPRHFVVFAVSPKEIIVMRLFHDAMDLPARLSGL